jgi:hypothetical protein
MHSCSAHSLFEIQLANMVDRFTADFHLSKVQLAGIAPSIFRTPTFLGTLRLTHAPHSRVLLSV